MGVLFLCVVAAVLIGLLRVNYAIDVHERIMHDVENEKY